MTGRFPSPHGPIRFFLRSLGGVSIAKPEPVAIPRGISVTTTTSFTQRRSKYGTFSTGQISPRLEIAEESGAGREPRVAVNPHSKANTVQKPTIASSRQERNTKLLLLYLLWAFDVGVSELSAPY